MLKPAITNRPEGPDPDQCKYIAYIAVSNVLTAVSTGVNKGGHDSMRAHSLSSVWVRG